VLDVDGVMTDGKMYYTAEGKWMKAFGADDSDALKEVGKHIQLCFITADKKGFPITEKRIESEMQFDLNLVSHLPKERWDWIKKQFPDKKIIFMGDGIFDYYSLQHADFGVTTIDALLRTQSCADYITTRAGGNRAVAEACLCIVKEFDLPCQEL
jgi:3-deoxy-D-manno-octulosonate 8-phosphate phosphatase (KDO 8-P phosphatase)